MSDFNGYRLHIDIPVGHDKDRAVEHAEEIMSSFTSEGGWPIIDKAGLLQVNYRLGNDLDRQKSNYLRVNENGHVMNKKCSIVLSKEDPNQTEFDFVSSDEC
tara:strand:+ start:653 stop:958 length:306 start_codon:yes stop_codon:yes gene_type:complete